MAQGGPRFHKNPREQACHPLAYSKRNSLGLSEDWVIAAVQKQKISSQAARTAPSRPDKKPVPRAEAPVIFCAASLGHEEAVKKT